MDRPKVLISEPLPLLAEDVKRLSKYADVRVASSPTEEVPCNEITDADLLMIVYAKVTSKLINTAPKLRAIVRFGIGVDNIDLPAATARKIIVVNVPDYAIETVSDHAFALMISLARKIIDEKALLRALREGWIAGAGLDVCEQEALSISNPLLELENVVLTPHIAWYTQEAVQRLETIAVERAIELLQGKIPKTVVNREALK